MDAKRLRPEQARIGRSATTAPPAVRIVTVDAPGASVTLARWADVLARLGAQGAVAEPQPPFSPSEGEGRRTARTALQNPSKTPAARKSAKGSSPSR